MSLGVKQHKVLQGTFGRINSKLIVSQLKAELRSGNVDLTNLKSTKKDLVPELKKGYYGVLSGCQFFYYTILSKI